MCLNSPPGGFRRGKIVSGKIKKKPILMIILAIAIVMAISGSALAQPVLKLNLSRLVVLDDPNNGNADIANGFSNPPQNWNSDYWNGESTTIRGYAVVMDKDGGIAGVTVTFTIRDPSGAQLAQIQATTDTSGVATFSYNLNGKNYYGYWTVEASATINGQQVSDSKTFIYNWWGCANCHGNKGPDKSGIFSQKSPYTMGYDFHKNPKKGDHSKPMINGFCTACHQGYDKIPHDPDAKDKKTITSVVKTLYSADIHNGKTKCQDCHVNANSGNQRAEIAGCYDTSGCHAQKNTKLTVMYTTTGYSVGGNYRTIYSLDTSTGQPSRAHTSTGTVPCLNCHGPAHDITKPFNSSWTSNSYTEDEQCLACHVNQGKHSTSNPVYCTACHSQDAHRIGILDKSTSGTNPVYTTLGSANAVTKNDCEACHTPGGISNFFNQLTNYDSQAYTNNYQPQTDSFGYTIAKHNGTVDCLVCHDNSDFHRITFLTHNGTYSTDEIQAVSCKDCHVPGVNDTVKTVVRNKGYNPPQVNAEHKRLPCKVCHSPSPHGGARYLSSDLQTYTTSRANAVTCTDCHDNSNAYSILDSKFNLKQYGIQSVPQINAFQHGNATINGQRWGNYWTNIDGACIYCHGNQDKVGALHFSTTYGYASVVKGGAQNLTGTWCANCHYTKAPGYVGNVYTIAPPTIDMPVTSNLDYVWVNHSAFLDTMGYNDSVCLECHYSDASQNMMIENFIHSASEWSGDKGGCVLCHTSYEGKDGVNESSFGRHVNVNKTDGVGNLTDADCTTCHSGAGSEMFKIGWTTPVVDCQNCHISGTPVSVPTDVKLTTFQHGNNDCKSCHIAGGYAKGRYYHWNYSTPLGAVKEPGWPGWTGNVVKCQDCHYSHSKRDEPFHAPGIGTYMATMYTSCGGGNCHGNGQIHDTVTVPYLPPPIVKISVSSQYAYVGDTVTVNAEVIGYNVQIYNASYRLERDGVVVQQGQLTPDDGKFGGVDSRGFGYEKFTFDIDTTGFEPGEYRIYITGEKDTGKSATALTTFTLSKGGVIPSPTAYNFGFESWTIGGTPVSWTNVSATVLQASPKSGNSSIALASSATGYLESAKFEVTPDASYRVTVYVKKLADGGYVGISVVQWNGSNMIAESPVVKLEGYTSDWVLLGIDIKADKNATNFSIRLYVSNTTAYFDDVGVIITPPVTTNYVVNGGFDDDWGTGRPDRYFRGYEYRQTPYEPIKAWEPKGIAVNGLDVNTTVAIGKRSAGIYGLGYWTTPYADTSFGTLYKYYQQYYALKLAQGVDFTVQYKIYSDMMSGTAGIQLFYRTSTDVGDDAGTPATYRVVVDSTTSGWVGIVTSGKMPVDKQYLQIKLFSEGANHVLFDEVAVY